MKAKKVITLIVLFVIAISAGELLGSAVENMSILSWLSKKVDFGFGPLVIDLSCLQFTLGLSFSVNVAQIILLIFVIVIFQKVLKLLSTE